MKDYIKFELKCIVGYAMGMLVGGLLPIILAVGAYHTSNNSSQDSLLAKEILSLCYPMVPLGLVILPFTISFAKDIEQGIETRFELFGYKRSQQLIAKFVAVLLLVFLASMTYFIVLISYFKLPIPSGESILLIILGLFFLTLSFYLLSFTIAYFFKGFGAIQAVAMITYFGIGFLSGTMGGFTFTGVMKTISDFIPFASFRDTLTNNWSNPSFDMSNPLLHFSLFLAFTIFLFSTAHLYSKNKRKAIS